MENIESLKIRPRLRIGAGRQTTFLPGNHWEVEKSHRRALGISEEDEIVCANVMIFRLLSMEGNFGSDIIRANYFVLFGADLTECYFSRGKDLVRVSKKWAKVRGQQRVTKKPGLGNEITLDWKKIEV